MSNSTADQTLASILRIAETSLTVSDLAVRSLWYAEPTWAAERAVGEMVEMSLDYAPVHEEPVHRYIDRSSLGAGSVGAHAMPIDASHLVSGDLGLADGLTLLAQRRFFFVIEGDLVVGIVGLADLQRPPVSMVTLALIMAAEAGMNRLIDAASPDEGWMDVLGDRCKRVEDVFRARQHRNAEITRLECLMLEDRLRLVGRLDEVWTGLGFRSRATFESWGEDLKRLRDPLAHGGSILDAEPDPDRALALLASVRAFAEGLWAYVDAREGPRADEAEHEEGFERPLLTATLRDDYEVFRRVDGSYAVVLIDRHQTRHEDRISAEVVEWLRERLRNREVDKDEAAEVLAPAAERLDLPFTYGHKLGFYAQEVLLVLVGRKEAGFDKVGRRFIYTVY